MFSGKQKTIETCIFSAPSKNIYNEAMKTLKSRYGKNRGYFCSPIKLNGGRGGRISDWVADFEILANEQKCFHSVLIHCEVNLEYFSGEVVKEILEHRLSAKMCAEFTNFMRAKGYVDDTSKYLPKLSNWVNEKIAFCQTDLGSSLLQNNNKNVNTKRSLAATSEYENKSNLNFYNQNSQTFDKNHTNSDDKPYSEKQGCIFCGEKGHKSLFDCHKFKDADPTNRFRFHRRYWLCWHCMELGHIASKCKNKKIKACDRYFFVNWFVPVSIKEKNILEALSVNRSLHSVCGECKRVRLPILPVWIYTPSGN